MVRLDPPEARCLRRMLIACSLLLTGALAGCAQPELVTGATGRPAALAPWQTQASASAEGERSLSEREGELVMATAIAAHEMRRP